MNYVDYLKLQAKNLFKDYQTKTRSSESPIGDYEYYPKYFDIHGIILYFDIDEDNFSLMNAQHIIAQIVGFRKWTDLLKASNTEQELAKLLFDNQDKISAEDWEMYIQGAERDNGMSFDPETRLEILRQVFVNVDGHVSTFPDYRLHNQIDRQKKEGDISQDDSSKNRTPSVMSMALESQLSFTDWLKKHINRNSPLGDFATDALRDKTWPLYNTLNQYRNYLYFRQASMGAIEALEKAWRSYRAYLRKKNLTIPVDLSTNKELFIEDKQKYLNDEYPFEDKPKLSDKVRCLHCDEIVVVGDYKVFEIDGEEYICCPNAPECNGTIIDWISLK